MIHNFDPARPKDSYDEMIKNLEDLADGQHVRAQQLRRTSKALKREGHDALAAQCDQQAVEHERRYQEARDQRTVLMRAHLDANLQPVAAAPRAPANKI